MALLSKGGPLSLLMILLMVKLLPAELRARSNTSQDIVIEDWERAGLKLPSVIRIHKIATLEKASSKKIREISFPIKKSIKKIFAKITE